MSRRILVVGDRAVALTIDGRLQELAIHDAKGPRIGDLHWARVVRRLGDGGFVDLGGGETGFLPAAKGLDVGDGAVVEVQRLGDSADAGPEASGRGKAARVGRRLSIRGRLATLTPGAPGVNVSRRIAKPAQAPLSAMAKAALAAETLGDDVGLVVRTAAAHAASEAPTEIAQLAARWREIARRRPSAPVRIARGSSAVELAVLDWTSPPPDLIEAQAGAPEVAAADALSVLAPGLAPKLRVSECDPFDTHDLYAAIAALLRPQVALTDTGWMSVERTAALIAIDVNASDARSRTAVNHAAALEIPRQLRLRGWGGMIVIDFAGAIVDEGRSRIEKALRQNAEAGLRLEGWGPLGLLEASRRWDRGALAEKWGTEQ